MGAAVLVSPDLAADVDENDVPTAQLDSETGRQVMRLLQTVVRSEGITALVATHDAGVIGLADEVLTLEDGKMGA